MARVLVVDDEPIVRDVVARYLERDGSHDLQACDGETARLLLESEQPELVVLDVMLPRVDGLSLMRWIRARSDLPVIMLTARGESPIASSGSSSALTTTSRSRSRRESSQRACETVLRRAPLGDPRGRASGVRRHQDRRR